MESQCWRQTLGQGFDIVGISGIPFLLSGLATCYIPNTNQMVIQETPHEGKIC